MDCYLVKCFPCNDEEVIAIESKSRAAESFNQVRHTKLDHDWPLVQAQRVQPSPQHVRLQPQQLVLKLRLQLVNSFTWLETLSPDATMSAMKEPNWSATIHAAPN